MSPLPARTEADVDSSGVRIHYEIAGRREPTILLLPTWTIVHRRLWKAQVPYLARHFRVVSYDGPGNGGSDRPVDSAAYDHDVQVQHALAVLDASETRQAVVVGLSQGCAWALQLAAKEPGRVLGTICIGASVDVTDGHPARLSADDPIDLLPSRIPFVERDPVEHWAKYDPAYWAAHYEDFLWFFFGMCFPEPHSTKQVEDCVGWGLHTTSNVLAAEAGGRRPDRRTVEEWCRTITSPVLTVHGSHDMISPPSRAQRIAELTGGEYVACWARGTSRRPATRCASTSWSTTSLLGSAPGHRTTRSRQRGNARRGRSVDRAMTTWGFIGSGNIGRTVARLAVAAGHEVVMSNSRGPETLADLVSELGPRARAGTPQQAAEAGDVVVVTIPFKNRRDVPVEPLRGKLVIDTMNYYPPRDGQVGGLDDGPSTSSELLQAHLPQSQVVKAFNNITAAHLGALARPAGSPDRSALTLAGDDADAKAQAVSLLDAIGYDVVDLGPLAEGWRTQPGTAAYGTMYASDTGDWSAPAQPASTSIVAAQAARSQR